MPSEVPVFGGRWQPFHNGHLSVLRSIVATHERVAVAVVNPDPRNPPDSAFDRFYPSANPLTYWQRAWMLHDLSVDEGWTRSVITIPTWHPRVSMEREENYFPPHRQRVWYVPIIDELEERKVADFETLGERVLRVEDVDADALSCRSTVVRNRLAADLAWEELVPPAIAKDLRAMQGAGDEDGWPIVAGRWQPFHNGHLWLVDHTVARYGRAVVGVVHAENLAGDPAHEYRSFRPVHNPFTYWERAEMLTDALAEAGLLDRCVIVPLSHPRARMAREEAFLPPNRIWVIARSSPHELGKIGGLMGMGEKVEAVDVPDDVARVASSDIKLRMAHGGDWESLIPASVSEYVWRRGGVDRVIAATAESGDELASYRSSAPQARPISGSDVRDAAPSVAELGACRRQLGRLQEGVSKEIAPRERHVTRFGPGARAEIREKLALWQAKREELAEIEALLDAADPMGSHRGPGPTDADRAASLRTAQERTDALGRTVFGDAW